MRFCLSLALVVSSTSFADTGRETETKLLLANGAATIAAVLRKSLRKYFIPASAVFGATAYTLRTIRLIRASDEDIDERQYAIMLNAAFIPLSVVGVAKGVPAFAEGWRGLLPFAIKEGATWRDKLVSLNWLVGFGIYGATDTYAHLKDGTNPLTSRVYWINRLYTVFGAVLTANALQRSGTLAGRIQATGVMSAAYALFNSMMQEIFFWSGGKDTNYRHLKFDQGWGMFHSAPRNLIDWSVWNWFASKAACLKSASIVGSILGVLRIGDTIQRADWYAHSKLDYLKGGKSWFKAVKDNLWPWRNDKTEPQLSQR